MPRQKQEVTKERVGFRLYPIKKKLVTKMAKYEGKSVNQFLEDLIDQRSKAYVNFFNKKSEEIQSNH